MTLWQHKNANTQRTGGVTLVEMLVAVSVFSMVVLIATTTLFSLIKANRQAQGAKLVMNNLNFIVESMTRSIRVGTNYKCDNGLNCNNGGDTIEFTSSQGDTIVYRHAGGQLTREVIDQDTGMSSGQLPLLTSNVLLENFSFYVTGVDTGSPDDIQPRVIIVMRGTVDTGAGISNSPFNIHTSVTQRVPEP